MLRRRTVRGRKNERGIVILLVAIVLLFVISAIAALAIDLVTFYTARSEAQLAADGAALAGARVLANSGMTSKPLDTTLAGYAKGLATTIAQQVAQNNQVGGRTLNASEVGITFPNDTDPAFGTNPHVTVQVTRSDLPTFFARIWGRGAVTVHATATAEAYNPSGMAALGKAPIPVATTCVKPWVLPNMSPTDLTGATQIFNPATGAIQDPALLAWEDPATPAIFYSRCTAGGCTPWPAPSPWQYYPGTSGSFPAPIQSVPTCGFALNAYQESIAGCVQTPIACNSTVDIDPTPHPGRNTQTVAAANCLTHALNNRADQIDPAIAPSPPFQFLAGDDNPIVGARGKDVFVSDSLVTVPVYDSTLGTPPSSTSTVTVIGFVQLFLNPDGQKASTAPNRIRTTVVNLVGCGATATGQPILGNGASAVPVRLITPP